MFSVYKKQVVDTYLKKRDAGLLSLNLTHATPAKLRAECITVFTERYLKKDENTLKAFFGAGTDGIPYQKTISKFDADKFRPLVNFLKESTSNTDDKNIELLAWLINYEDRPYKFGQNHTTDDDWGSNVENQGSAQNDDPTQSELNTSQNKLVERPPGNGADKAVKIKNRVILLTILAFIITGTYLSLRNKTTLLVGTEKCMYWAGDHYQPISCNQTVYNKQVLALDTLKLLHFKAITRPDTITMQSVGKVWYFKSNGHLELYTANGYHPIHTERLLKPLTGYMLNKYILHKDTLPR